MKVIEYFTTENKEHWLNEIQRSDWSAGQFLYQLLHNDFNIVRSPRSYNSQLGVPLSVWQMNEKHTLGIFEAGISQPDEMERLQPIIAPTIGVITNIGEAHQENFISANQKCLEKLMLFKDCEALVYNGDDAFFFFCLESACLSHKALVFRSSSFHRIDRKRNRSNGYYLYLVGFYTGHYDSVYG